MKANWSRRLYPKPTKTASRAQTEDHPGTHHSHTLTVKLFHSKTVVSKTAKNRRIIGAASPKHTRSSLKYAPIRANRGISLSFASSDNCAIKRPTQELFHRREANEGRRTAVVYTFRCRHSNQPDTCGRGARSSHNARKPITSENAT